MPIGARRRWRGAVVRLARSVSTLAVGWDLWRGWALPALGLADASRDYLPVSVARRLGLNSDFDWFAAWEQSEDIVQFAGQLVDFAFDRFATLLEM